jgi:lactate dehydrogenase-like 2-hydroxyacid dehydrogenase
MGLSFIYHTAGVLYCNSAIMCTESVADAAIWLMLDTFRNFSWSAKAARSLDPGQFWDAHRNIAAVTHNPKGHNLGIIGLGNIGFRIAQKAHTAFGMKILYNDLVRKAPEVESSVEAVFYEELTDMLAVSDCVIVATPFGGSKVLDGSTISKMKHGSRFCNIARGKLIDEDALISALESGQIAAAGLDVHYNEPHVNPRFANMKNVVVMCHTAGASIESHIGFEKLGMENLLSFLETGKALTPVNAHLLPNEK